MFREPTLRRDQRKLKRIVEMPNIISHKTNCCQLFTLFVNNPANKRRIAAGRTQKIRAHYLVSCIYIYMPLRFLHQLRDEFQFQYRGKYFVSFGFLNGTRSFYHIKEKRLNKQREWTTDLILSWKKYTPYDDDGEVYEQRTIFTTYIDTTYVYK